LKGGDHMQERVDQLAMLYIQSHYDIKSMSIPEFLKVFDETCNEIIATMESAK
jgi:uncharacterized protein YutE (UPF0331/DUF86 family)